MGKLLAKYRGLVPEETIDAIRRHARHLAGKSVLHITSGRFRSDVTRMLAALERLFEDVGLQFRSATMVGTEEFFDLVRQADEGVPPNRARSLGARWSAFYEDAVRENARKMFLSSDLVVVHGLEPLGLIDHRRDDRPWVWRCHADLSKVSPALWSFAARFASQYQASVFSHVRFVPEIRIPHFIVPPSTDAFGPANSPMNEKEIRRSLAELGIPAGRPMALWFLSTGTAQEALSAVRAWKRSRLPDEALLVLVEVDRERSVGRDPSASEQDALRGIDRSVHFVSLGQECQSAMCALSWAACVAIDVSESRWPNLHLLDTMWKEKPALVAAGSATATLVGEETGVHLRSEEELSRALSELLGDPEKSRALGRVARETVARNYLAPRHLLDYLNLLLYFNGDAARG